MSGDTGHSQAIEIGHLRAPIVLAHENAFRIGAAEFRPATREVRFDGQTTVIEPRVMQFLIALHRAKGAVVNKDDLLKSCWDGRIVGDDAINRIVSRLRGVADKEAGRAFRVETITRVGYRLLSADGEAIDQTIAAPVADEPAARRPTARHARAIPSRHMAVSAVAILSLLGIAAAVWWWFRPVAAAGHSMMVRLADFRPLSADLPATMRDSINAEIVAAFNVDGVVGVSRRAGPAARTGPSYVLDGTIYRIGESIRVITRLTNERSGMVLWSDRADYAADQISKIPHKIAIEVGTVVRCGLSGAATHAEALPDPVLSNYMQYCQEYWSHGGSKTLYFAQRVVDAVPNFSWGWSAVGNGFMQASWGESDEQRVEAMRAAGRRAEDKAIALDPNNSEALAHKAYLIDPRDWAGQEQLFKRAIAAKPLDCGCEHYGYGLKLESVGRVDEAIAQYRAATDMLALWPESQLALGRALVTAERTDLAYPAFKAAIELSKDPNLDKEIAVSNGIETGDYPAAIKALRSAGLNIPDESRTALLSGYEALMSGASDLKANAVRKLLALPADKRGGSEAAMLGALGANREALRAVGDRPWLFWRRHMRGVLNDPAFPGAAARLGLMTYWRTSGTKPDVCTIKDAPPFCRML